MSKDVELVITPSWVNVYGCGDADRLLDEALSSPNPNAYWVNKKRKEKWKNMPEIEDTWHLYDRVKRRFPRGLAETAMRVLQAEGMRVNISMAPGFLKPKNMRPKYLSNFVPRDYQEEAVEQFMKSTNGIINIPTRGGKTPVGLMIASMFTEEHPVLYLVTKIEAQQEVIESWYEWFDLGMATNEVLLSPGLSVITYNTAINRDLSHFKVVIGDEIHRAGAAKFYDAIMRCEQAWYRVGLSGSAEGRSDGKDNFFIGAAGPIVYKLPRKVLQDRGFCSTGRVLTVDVPGETKAVKGNWLSLEKHGIVENVSRDGYLASCLIEHFGEGDQALVMVQKKQHGIRFARMLSQAMDFEVPFLSSDLSNKKRLEYYEKLKSGELRMAVASPIFDDSVTLPCLTILVNAAGGKSVIATTQRLGRGLSGDKEILVIDANDLHHPSLKKHSRARFKVYEQEGYECTTWDPQT